MYTYRALIAAVLVGATGGVAPAQPGASVTILETFEGTAKNDKKPDLKGGFIATQAKWKEAWGKVNPKAKLPKVDFTKHFLLVYQQDAADPNRIGASVVKDAKGVVSMRVISTLIGFRGSDTTKYRFYKVSREGVAGVRSYDGAKGAAVDTPLPKAAAKPGVEPD